MNNFTIFDMEVSVNDLTIIHNWAVENGVDQVEDKYLIPEFIHHWCNYIKLCNLTAHGEKKK